MTTCNDIALENLYGSICKSGSSPIMLYGDSTAHTAAHVIAASALFAGRRVFMVTGANRANPYFARQLLHDHTQLLRKFLISRSFTCHQFQNTVCEMVRDGEKRNDALLILLGPGEIIAASETSKGEALPAAMKVGAAIAKLAPKVEMLLVTEHLPSDELARKCFRIFWRRCRKHVRVYSTSSGIYFYGGEYGKNPLYLYRPGAFPPGAAGEVPPGAAQG